MVTTRQSSRRASLHKKETMAIKLKKVWRVVHDTPGDGTPKSKTKIHLKKMWTLVSVTITKITEETVTAVTTTVHAKAALQESSAESDRSESGPL